VAAIIDFFLHSSYQHLLQVLSERGHNIVMKNDPEMRIPEENLVVLNPDDKDEAELMVLRMGTRRARAKAEKAAKKAKRKAADTSTSATATVNGEEEQTSSKVAKAAAEVAAGEKGKTNGGGSGAFKNGGKLHSDKSSRNGGSATSVQGDPTKSEVYKSLFSSHKSALNKPKGNWVTFDPRYN